MTTIERDCRFRIECARRDFHRAESECRWAWYHAATSDPANFIAISPSDYGLPVS